MVSLKRFKVQNEKFMKLAKTLFLKFRPLKRSEPLNANLKFVNHLNNRIVLWLFAFWFYAKSQNDNYDEMTGPPLSQLATLPETFVNWNSNFYAMNNKTKKSKIFSFLNSFPIIKCVTNLIFKIGRGSEFNMFVSLPSNLNFKFYEFLRNR